MSQYYQPIEAEMVLYTLWERREEKQPTKLRVKLIDDPALSERRSVAVARYAVRVIAPEHLSDAGLLEEAQKLRDLPLNVDLARACDVIETAHRVVYGVGPISTANAINDVTNAIESCSIKSYNIVPVYSAIYSAIGLSSKRFIHHLDEMIQLCLEIRGTEK